MIWSLLADALVVVHFVFTMFVILGGFLTWRWRPVALVHLPALAWGCWVEVSGAICPLTPLENHLRHHGGFLAHYLVAVLYPPGLNWRIQWVLAALLIGLNGLAYGRLLVRPRPERERLP